MESKVLFRTFIAIPLEMPPELKETLAWLKKEFEDERIRWVDPGQMHITLRFLGDTGEEEVNAIKARFSKNYEAYDQSDLMLHGLGTFGHRSALKVLWAGIVQPGKLADLHAATQSMLEGIVAPDRNRVFKPHLTLARMKRLRDEGLFRKKIEQFRDLDLGICAMEKVVFYRSLLQPSGAVYEVLAYAAFNSSRFRSAGRLS